MAPVMTRSQKNALKTVPVAPTTSTVEDISREVEQTDEVGLDEASRQLVLQGYIVNDIKPIRLLCDSGASVSFCAPEVYKRLRNPPPLHESSVEIVLGNGDVQDSMGYFKTQVILQSVPLDVTFYIMELPTSSFMAILGERFLFIRHRAILSIYDRSISFLVQEKDTTREPTRKQVSSVAVMQDRLPERTEVDQNEQLASLIGSKIPMIQESEAMMAPHVTQKHRDYSLIELVDSKRFEKIYKEHRNKRKDDEQGWLLMLSHKDIECTSDVQMIDHAEGGGERKLQPMDEVVGRGRVTTWCIYAIH
eukprot:SAG11_NODE_6889_length_1230_cov_22.626879_1_plen_306_part_00